MPLNVEGKMKTTRCLQGRHKLLIFHTHSEAVEMEYSGLFSDWDKMGYSETICGRGWYQITVLRMPQTWREQKWLEEVLRPRLIQSGTHENKFYVLGPAFPLED